MNIDVDKLDRDCRKLIDELADRLPQPQLRFILGASKAGEWAEMLELLSAVLLDEGLAIKPEHRKALAELLDMFGPLDDTEFPLINHRASTIAALTIES